MYPKVDIILVGNDNYAYLLHSRDNTGVAIIDPGDNKAIQRELEKRKLKPLEIWLTHKHSDHISGATSLATYYDIPIRCSSEVSSFTAKIKRTLPNTKFLFGNAEVSVSIIGGHTKEHLIFYTDNILFTGDILFIGGCGRIFEGRAEEMYSGIVKYILSLPDTTRIYCGHEYAIENLKFALYLEPYRQETIKHFNNIKRLRDEGKPSVPGDLGIEKLTNPFLRTNDPDLYRAISSRWDNVPKEPAKLFAFIRALKDNY